MEPISIRFSLPFNWRRAGLAVSRRCAVSHISSDTIGSQLPGVKNCGSYLSGLEPEVVKRRGGASCPAYRGLESTPRTLVGVHRPRPGLWTPVAFHALVISAI